MPGPITHLVVQQRLQTMLRELGGDRGNDLASLLEDDPCSPYTGFGSMGPDFLFFSVKEYGDELASLVNTIVGLYDKMRPFIKFYEDHIEPIEKEIDNVKNFIDETFFDGLFKQLNDTFGTAKDALLFTAANMLVQQVDPFYLFFPKIQKGAEEKDWYWFDFLHYRRTGRFCSAMWNIAEAQGDSDLLRYVIGYGSHIGTDVVGHPYVNAVVGGPYRLHWRRHKLVENWIDAYARNHYGDPDWLVDCAQLADEDFYSATSISGSNWWKLVHFDGDKLPEKLGNMFVDAMKTTYTGIPNGHPPMFDYDDLNTTYHLWIWWFRNATSIGSARKPEHVPPPGTAAISLVKKYFDSFPSPPSLGGGGGGGGFSIKNLFKKLWEFAKWLGDIATHTGQWLVDNLPEIAKLPVTTGLEFLKWILNKIHRAIYDFYDTQRFALVLAGLLFPEADDLQRPMNGGLLWANAFIGTQAAHTTGGGIVHFSQYPLRRKNHNETGPSEHHLTYPKTLRERMYAEPMPQVFYNAMPEHFISDGFLYDPQIEALYNATEAYGNNMNFTDFIDRQTWTTGQLGSAIDFCARLIGNHIEDLPNFNLDGDRGYGWKTWEAIDPQGFEDSKREDLNDPNFPPVDTRYIDS